MHWKKESNEYNSLLVRESKHDDNCDKDSQWTAPNLPCNMWHMLSGYVFLMVLFENNNELTLKKNVTVFSGCEVPWALLLFEISK